MSLHPKFAGKSPLLFVASAVAVLGAGVTYLRFPLTPQAQGSRGPSAVSASQQETCALIFGLQDEALKTFPNIPRPGDRSVESQLRDLMEMSRYLPPNQEGRLIPNEPMTDALTKVFNSYELARRSGVSDSDLTLLIQPQERGTQRAIAMTQLRNAVVESIQATEVVFHMAKLTQGATERETALRAHAIEILIRIADAFPGALSELVAKVTKNATFESPQYQELMARNLRELLGRYLTISPPGDVAELSDHLENDLKTLGGEIPQVHPFSSEEEARAYFAANAPAEFLRWSGWIEDISKATREGRIPVSSAVRYFEAFTQKLDATPVHIDSRDPIEVSLAENHPTFYFLKRWVQKEALSIMDNARHVQGRLAALKPGFIKTELAKLDLFVLKNLMGFGIPAMEDLQIDQTRDFDEIAQGVLSQMRSIVAQVKEQPLSRISEDEKTQISEFLDAVVDTLWASKDQRGNRQLKSDDRIQLRTLARTFQNP